MRQRTRTKAALIDIFELQMTLILKFVNYLRFEVLIANSR